MGSIFRFILREAAISKNIFQTFFSKKKHQKHHGGVFSNINVLMSRHQMPSYFLVPKQHHNNFFFVFFFPNENFVTTLLRYHNHIRNDISDLGPKIHAFTVFCPFIQRLCVFAIFVRFLSKNNQAKSCHHNTQHITAHTYLKLIQFGTILIKIQLLTASILL